MTENVTGLKKEKDSCHTHLEVSYWHAAAGIAQQNKFNKNFYDIA